MDTPTLDAFNESVKAASHLGALDKGAVEAARALARKIDTADEYFEALTDDAAEMNRRPPSVDNVSIPTFLKFCESLGLTPAGRVRGGVEKGAPVKPVGVTSIKGRVNRAAG